MSNKIRQKIYDILKEFLNSPEVLPAQPKTKPDVKPAPAKPNPRRILRPRIHPGADPAPKAKKKVILQLV